jgi:hypothetical protein
VKGALECYRVVTFCILNLENYLFSSGRRDLNSRPLDPEYCGNLGIEGNEGSFVDLNYMESIELHKLLTFCLQ